MIELPRKLYDEIVAHAQEGWPDEVCGLISGRSSCLPLRIHRITNVAPNPPTLYIMDPEEQYRTITDIEDQGLDLWGIYHSHPSSEAYPSKTDRGYAFYPDSYYFICSLQDRARPVLRGFLIHGDEVLEQGIRVVDREPGEEVPGACC